VTIAQITIGITAFREGEFLREAVESLLRQTDPRWKAVLVLDGGHDQLTLEIAKGINDSRFKLIILEENRGPYKSMNLAIKNCETQNFMFLGGDDFLSLSAIDLANEAFEDPTTDYICVGVNLFWEDGSSNYLPPSTVSVHDLLLNGKFPGLVGFRKELWSQLGGYDDRHLNRGRADQDFALRAISQGYKARLIDEPFYHYRQKSGGSVSRSYSWRIGRINDIIVKRNPQVFDNDDELKRKFLHQGFLASAVNCYSLRRYRRALYFAKRGLQINENRFAFFPISCAGVLPRYVIDILVRAKSIAGMIKRFVIKDKLK
jgi:glycosyltransferase involved in cell wall biosynthesis